MLPPEHLRHFCPMKHCINDEIHPLVVRENMLKKLFERGGYSNKYIKKTVMSNEGYKNLPSTSPGFEDL